MVFIIEIENACKKLVRIGRVKSELLVWGPADAHVSRNSALIKSTYEKIGPVLDRAVKAKLQMDIIKTTRDRYSKQLARLMEMRASEQKQNDNNGDDNDDENKNEDDNDMSISTGASAQKQNDNNNNNNNNNNNSDNLAQSVDDLIQNQSVGKLTDKQYQELLKCIETEHKTHDKNVNNLNNSWDYLRNIACLENIYILCKVASLSPQEVQCLEATNKLRGRYLCEFNTTTMGDEHSVDEIVQDIYDVAKHRLFGVFWKGIIKSVWKIMKTEKEKKNENANKNENENEDAVNDYPSNDKQLKRCIKYFLTEIDIAQTVHILFEQWSDMEYTDLTSNKIPDCKPTNKSSENILKFTELVKLWNEQSDIMYNTGKFVGVYFRVHFANICKYTMPARWEKLISGKDTNIQQQIKEMILLIISGACFKDYVETQDKPELPLLRIAQAQLCHWLRTILTSTFKSRKKTEIDDKEWFVPDAHLKQTDRKAKGLGSLPGWVKIAHFPILIGLFNPLLVLNHFPFRRHGNDLHVNDISHLLSDNNKVFKLSSPLMSFICSWFRVFCDPKKGAPNRGAASLIRPKHCEHFLSNVRKSKKKTHKWITLFRWWKKQPHWFKWLYYNQVMKIPLGEQLEAYVKHTGDWNRHKIWNTNCDTSELPTHDYHEYSWIHSLLPQAMALGVGAKRILNVVHPIADIDKLVAVGANNEKIGFDLMCYDAKGMKINKTEAEHLDKFCRTAALNPVIVNGNYSQEQTFVSMYKNTELLHNPLIGFAKVSNSIDPESPTQEWVNKHLYNWDQCMSIYIYI